MEDREQSIAIMSSTGQATPSTSNIQLIIDTLADYTKITRIDLSKHPFAFTLKQSNSPEAIVQLLHRRGMEFAERGFHNQKLLSFLNLVAKVLNPFSGMLGEAVSQVPIPPTTALFIAIDVLLDVPLRITASYDPIVDLFEQLGIFLKHLEIYTAIACTPIMMDIILKIMVELLLVLALATKRVKEGRCKYSVERLRERNMMVRESDMILRESEKNTTFQRLDELTQDKARMTAKEHLGVIHGLVGNLKTAMEDYEASRNRITQDSWNRIRKDSTGLGDVRQDSSMDRIRGIFDGIWSLFTTR